MTEDASEEKQGTADAAPTGDMPAPRPSAPGTMAERVDTALAGPARTMVGGVGLVAAPAPATMLMHSAHAASGTVDLAGRVVKGRYLIKRLLGEGGMGGVYEGEHIEIGRRVAIKLVSSVHARDPHIAARIKQEARSTGAIESEHIVQVFDAGEDDELGLFLVMELLKGEDLSAMLARQKGLPLVTAISLIAQAAQGLSRAHAARIVHRDLKPANIFICTRDDGSSLVKLVDFGIAKLLRDASDKRAGSLTRMGMVIGTPQYMSPEQAQGLPTVDHRTDVYSLGAVLFETIAGQSPFTEMPTYEQTILQIMMKQAPRLQSVVPGVLPSIDLLCSEMLQHDPAARPQDMTQVRDRLLRILVELGAPASSGTDVTAGAANDAPRAWQGSISGADDAASTTAADAAARLSLPGTESAVDAEPRDDVPSIAGLRRNRPGLLAAAGLFCVGAAIAGAVMVVRAPKTGPTTVSSAGFAAIQAARSAAPAPGGAATSPPASGAGAVTSAAPAATTSAPVASIPSAPAAASGVTAGAENAKPSSATGPARATKPKPATTKPPVHRVGATDIVDDF